VVLSSLGIAPTSQFSRSRCMKSIQMLKGLLCILWTVAMKAYATLSTISLTQSDLTTCKYRAPPLFLSPSLVTRLPPFLTPITRILRGLSSVTTSSNNLVLGTSTVAVGQLTTRNDICMLLSKCSPTRSLHMFITTSSCNSQGGMAQEFYP